MDIDTGRGSSTSTAQQYWLSTERQKDLFSGQFVPLVDAARNKQKEETEEAISSKQLILRLERELQLELPVNSSIHHEQECKRGVKATFCQHSVDHGKYSVVPLFCGLGKCASSETRNSERRSNRFLYGKNDRISEENGEVTRLGVSKLVNNFDLGVMVFTIPEHLRKICSSVEYIKRWHKACLDILLRILRKNGAKESSLYAIKLYLHPNGEDSSVWKPHLNYLFPLCHWTNGKIYRQKSYIPHSWLKGSYWREEYRKAIEKEFGFPIFDEGDEKELNFFYEVRVEPERKAHAIRYFSRQFSGYTLINGQRFNPRNIGLLSPKRAGDLEEILGQLPAGQGAAEYCRHGSDGDPCQWKAVVANNEAELDDVLKRFGISSLCSREGPLKPHVGQGIAGKDPPLSL